MYENILIAIDGSLHASRGLAAGLDLAKLTGAKVTVLTVSEPFPVYDLASKMGLLQDATAIETYTVTCKSVAERILAEAVEAAATKAVAIESLYIADSSPAKAILDAAKFRSCDLIVMASHGLSGLERFVIGSQVARVVRSAETDVLVIR